MGRKSSSAGMGVPSSSSKEKKISLKQQLIDISRVNKCIYCMAPGGTLLRLNAPSEDGAFYSHPQHIQQSLDKLGDYLEHIYATETKK